MLAYHNNYFHKISSPADLLSEHTCSVAMMCLQAIRCNIQAFCCNGLQGVTWSYMALQDHLVSVTAIFFTVMSKLPVPKHELIDIA
jgi:hypothetical protein